MKPVHVVLILVVLTGPVTSLFRRKHVLVKIDSKWAGALAYCRNNFVDLSTIDSAEELSNFKADIQKDVSVASWVGLSKKATDINFNEWSDGSLLGEVVWAKDQPDHATTEHCVISKDAQLSDVKCTNTAKFICYSWEPELMVVQEMKTWDEALKHCRTFYTDLISVDTTTDQFVVNNKSLDIKTSAVWTALHFLDGSWFWVNNQTRANITSLGVCPIRPFICGARRAGAEVWESRDCEEQMNFMCYHTA